MDEKDKKTEKKYSLKNPPPDGWSISHVTKLRQLPGHFDRVHLAQIKSSKEHFVLKKLKKKNQYPPSSSILLEKEMHLNADHPNVISTYGYFETATALYLMMEFAEGGDLFSAALGSKSESEVAKFVRQVVLGLKYLHDTGVVHRDLKAENVVVSAADQCKIIDFGFAAKLPLGGLMDGGPPAGTLDYLSPEVVWGLAYDYSSDIWSLGVLTYVLLCGHYPFAPMAEVKGKDREPFLVKAILEGEMFKGSAFLKVSRRGQDFISRLLVKSPKKRMKLGEVLRHPFLIPRRSLSRSSSNETSSTYSGSSSPESFLPVSLVEPGEIGE